VSRLPCCSLLLAQVSLVLAVGPPLSIYLSFFVVVFLALALFDLSGVGNEWTGKLVDSAHEAHRRLKRLEKDKATAEKNGFAFNRQESLRRYRDSCDRRAAAAATTNGGDGTDGSVRGRHYNCISSHIPWCGPVHYSRSFLSSLLGSRFYRGCKDVLFKGGFGTMAPGQMVSRPHLLACW
jgi:hypothetical protein